MVRNAKASGVPISAETCPHYLFCTEDDLERAGPFGKINPPIRRAEDRDALWAALADGTLDYVATDHAPFTAEEKEAARGDILNAPPGHPGVEYLVPLLLTEALRGRWTLERAAHGPRAGAFLDQHAHAFAGGAISICAALMLVGL